MTEQQLAAMRQALKSLEHMLEDAKQERLTVEYWNECVDGITALRTDIEEYEEIGNAYEKGWLECQALSKQEPVAQCK